MSTTPTQIRGPRPRPVLVPEYCKGCGRCVDACEHQCIAPGTVINADSGLVPVAIDLERCTGCGLCFDACPEPYGLQPALQDSCGALTPMASHFAPPAVAALSARTDLRRDTALASPP